MIGAIWAGATVQAIRSLIGSADSGEASRSREKE